MTRKKKSPVGRPKKTEEEKVKPAFAYITGPEQARINKKYGNITQAVRLEILPKCPG
jgi:hypothetical protein